MDLLITAKKVTDIAIGDSEVFMYAQIKDALILAAEYRYLRPILTDALYDRIKQEVKDENISEEVQELITNYIEPALAYYVKKEAIPDLMLKITNLGGQKPNTENSQPISKDERDKLRETALNIANAYMDEFTRYMNQTKPEGIAEELRTKYPEYEKFRNVKNRISKTGGIVFSRKKC